MRILPKRDRIVQRHDLSFVLWVCALLFSLYSRKNRQKNQTVRTPLGVACL